MAWFDRSLTLEGLLDSKPGIHCRAATKNEPGLKRRPLHATDDVSFLIESYVSSGMEKTVSNNGIVMRQRPSDIQEVEHHTIANAGHEFIVCCDYSDFNRTHVLFARYLLAASIARRMKLAGSLHRARAATWTARAHLNHTINGKLVNQGLSSGERDTARDNTMLHTVYQRMAESVLNTNYGSMDYTFKRFCGDDEIIIGMQWLHAIEYIAELKRQKHGIQSRKIMMSRTTGEFLQYNFTTDGSLPTQPLAPALVNFLSGSWYKRNAAQKDKLAEQIASSAAGLYRRGMAYSTATRLAISACSWLLKDYPWRNMLASTDFFGRQDVPQPKFKKTVDRVYKREEHTPKAVVDNTAWLTTQYPGIHKYVDLDSFSHTLKDAVHGHVIGKATTYELSDEQDSVEWLDHIDIVDNPNVDTLKLSRDWILSAEGDRVDPFELLAMHAGVPIEWLKGPNKYKVLALMPNNLIARVNNADPKGMQVTPIERASLPGGIVAYAT
uniref:RNA-directed RNA polymerase n=1 Tax=Phytophthora palustris toti-like virus 4 TaxID=2976315 RepID=A0A9E8YW08_9VIRU|nr:RNA-dependent RNA polymerase [Phytophthora palustris toti-like virus 4]